MDPTSTDTPTADTTTAPATQSAAAPATQPAPVFTAEQVEAARREAAQQASNAAWKAAREKYEKGNGATSGQPTTQPVTQPTAQPAPAGLTAQDIVRLGAFTAAAGTLGLTARATEMLTERFMVDKPADPRAWVEEQAAAYGWQKPTPTTTTPATASAVATAPTNTVPVTGNAAPTSAARVTNDTPFLSRTEADRQAHLGMTDGRLPSLEKVREYTEALMAEARRGARLTIRR